MAPAPPLQPTLWRTCRVLASHTRLTVFGQLVDRAPQTVSAVARRLQLDLPVASQALRALEARGLLTVRRVGRWAQYSPSIATGTAVSGLMGPLRSAFRRGNSPVGAIFERSTAFTHPRRIEIFRTLQARPLSLDELRAATRISTPALLRHLDKLEVRRFVVCRAATYAATRPPDAFGRALARLAAA